MIFNQEESDTSVLISTQWTVIGILVLILIYFLVNPEKAEKWGSIIARLFSFMSGRIEKYYISKDIQYKINKFKKEIDSECQGLIPYKTEIKFINPSYFGISDAVEHYEDKVIIIMKDRKNQDENFVRASILSTEKTLIPNSRHYVYKPLMKSIDLQFIKNLISSTSRTTLNFYIDNFLALEVKKNPELEKNLIVLEKLNEQGIFIRILLQELNDYGIIFHPNLATSNHFAETKNFFNQLEELANKKHHEDVKLSFTGNYIKTSFILIGITSKVFKPRGIDTGPYKQRVFFCEEQGIKSVYILAWGINNIAANKLAEDLDKIPERFQKISVSNYKVKLNTKKIEAVCIRYRLLKNQ